MRWARSRRARTAARALAGALLLIAGAYASESALFESRIDRMSPQKRRIYDYAIGRAAPAGRQGESINFRPHHNLGFVLNPDARYSFGMRG